MKKRVKMNQNTVRDNCGDKITKDVYNKYFNRNKEAKKRVKEIRLKQTYIWIENRRKQKIAQNWLGSLLLKAFHMPLINCELRYIVNREKI